jgi:CRP-like cAMP-binding protein
MAEVDLELSGFSRFARSFQPGEMIFSEFEPGDAFYLIQAGRVELVKIIGDIEKTLDILQPSDMFGEMAILENSPRSATAIALDTVKVLEFNRQNFEILMMGNPQIALKLLRMFTKRIYDQKRRFMILTLNEPQAKVADVFLMLDETLLNFEKFSERREFKTTVDDIAHWAGISVTEARETIGHFVNQRRMELYPDKIVLKNINDFSRYVNSRRKQGK